MNKSGIHKRHLGKSNLEVTEIGLGLWAVGGGLWGPVEDSESIKTIHAALDSGITFFDTADVYGDGHSEEILGRAMRGKRDKFILATKIGWRGFDDQKKQTAYDSVTKFIAGVETNLKRLNTDYIDVLQSHINFRDPTMEVFLHGFSKLKQQGKIKAFGLSTSDFEYLNAFNHKDDCATLQIDYSILNRTAEAEIIPYCKKHNIGIIIRGALAMGILTGKFSADSTFAEGDFRSRWLENPEEKEIFLNDLEKVEKLRSLTNGRTLAQLALQFVLANPDISVVIPGAKRVSQLQENLKAALLPPLTNAECEYIDGLVAKGGGRKIWPA
ncbi:MAG: aldo/keto reductase [Spirochaetales bacterium]|nr:aldo/keto reductase [Spirochaetales bacterium]